MLIFRKHVLLYFISFSKQCTQLFRELLSDSNSLISGVFLCPGSSQEDVSARTFDLVKKELKVVVGTPS